MMGDYNIVQLQRQDEMTRAIQGRMADAQKKQEEKASKQAGERRRKAIFGQARRQLGTIFHALARQKECEIIEGHLMPDHVQMCMAIPPKHPVASVIGFLKGKSAIAIARLCGKERNFAGEHFWARGYAVSTVGFELDQVRQYIRDQDVADGAGAQF